MSGTSEVRITFVGDAGSVPAAATQVGDSMARVSREVDGASRSMVDSGAGFDRAQEGFDTVDTRAMGFRDTVTGVQDSVLGFGAILKGDFSADALVTAGMGVGDLASGFVNLLVPQLKQAVTWLGSTAVGKKAVAAAQWLWNAAMSANPIGLVIIAIVALVSIFVVLWAKCEWFRNFWKDLWKGIQAVAKAVADWFSGPFIQFFKDAWKFITDGFQATVDRFKQLPGQFKNAFMGLVDIITWPFRTAFNFVSDAWNNTVGKLRWTVPSWVPIIGGNTIAAPHLPRFHSGVKRVPGLPGQEMLAILEAGEEVVSANNAGSSGSVTNIYNITIPVEDLEELKTVEEFVEMFKNDDRRGVEAPA